MSVALQLSLHDVAVLPHSELSPKADPPKMPCPGRCGRRVAVIDLAECPVCLELFGPCCLESHDCTRFLDGWEGPAEVPA